MRHEATVRKNSAKTTFRFTLYLVRALLFVLCASVQAQQRGKIFRIGYLEPTTVSGSAALLETFRQELSKLGWMEGKNLVFEYRFAENKSERVPELRSRSAP